MKEITQVQHDQLLILQQEEINGYHTYNRLSKIVKDAKNSKILKRIAGEEFKHYKIWKEYTQQEIAPNKWKIRFFFWISKLFGLTFGIRLMELGEEKVQVEYDGRASGVNLCFSEHEPDRAGWPDHRHLRVILHGCLGVFINKI